MTNIYKIENLDNLLQCPICRTRFHNPKVLHCQHTFCFTCLQNIYDTQNQTLICSTCQQTMNLPEGLDELPDNFLIVNLMKAQPIRAKCPSCKQIDTLTICEHCYCTKCLHCNEKHVNDMRQSIGVTFDQLQNTDQNELKVSIRRCFKTKRNALCRQFENIRQKHNFHLVNKQMEILEQLKLHEELLLIQMENDFQSLEQTKLDIMKGNDPLTSKTEPELINLYAIVSSIQHRLTDKLTEYHTYLNSIEFSFQYDPEQAMEINRLCETFQLIVSETKEKPTLFLPPESINVTLRTYLNQDYHYRRSHETTIFELKELFSKQENLDPDKIILTKLDSPTDELANDRTLKSYDCNSSSILLVYLRK